MGSIASYFRHWLAPISVQVLDITHSLLQLKQANRKSKELTYRKMFFYRGAATTFQELSSLSSDWLLSLHSLSLLCQAIPVYKHAPPLRSFNYSWGGTCSWLHLEGQFLLLIASWGSWEGAFNCVLRVLICLEVFKKFLLNVVHDHFLE